MCDALVNLLSESLSPDLDKSARATNTENLVQLYHDKTTVFLCFDVLKSDSDETIRLAATISLKYSLQYSWSGNLNDTEYVERVKEEIVSLMKGGIVGFVFSCFIHSIRPVIESCINTWDDLYLTLKGIAKGMTSQSLQAIECVCECIRVMDTNKIDSEFTYFMSLAQYAFGISSVDAVRIGEQLLGALISRVDPVKHGRFAGPCEVALTTYVSCVCSNPVESVALTGYFKEWAEAGINLFDHASVILFLFDTIRDVRDRLSILLLFDLIQWCLSLFGEEIVEALFDNISLFWIAAEHVFESHADLGGQGDLFFVQDGISASFSLIDPIYIFDELMKEISYHKTTAQLVSWLGALLRCISSRSYLVIDRVAGIANMLVENLQHPNICVQELIIEIIREVAHFGVMEMCYTIRSRNAFVDPLFNLLFSHSSVVVSRALSALTELLKIASMSDLAVKPMVMRINELMEFSQWKLASVNALASFIVSAGAKSLCYWDLVCPSLQTGLKCDDMQVKSNCVTAIGVYLTFSREKSKVENGWSFIQNFIGDESVLVRASIAKILCNFYQDSDFKCTFPEHLEPVTLVVTNTLEYYQNQKSAGLSDEGIEYVASGLRLFKSILEDNETLFPNLVQYSDACLSAMSDSSVSISVYSTQCMSYLVSIQHDLAPKFFSTLREIMMTGLELVWKKDLKTISRLIEHDVQIPSDVTECVVQLMQTENDDVKKAAFATLSFLAGSNCQTFPIEQFNVYLDSFDNNTDIERVLNVLFNLYRSGKNGDIISKASMIERFVKGLPICDFCLWPTPLEAIEWAAEHEMELIKPYVSQIVEYSNKLFDAKDRNFKHFLVTIEAMVSVNLTFLANKVQGCDFNTIMTAIMKKLKTGLPMFFADQILYKLVSIFDMRPYAIQFFALDLITVIVSVLSLPEKEFEQLKLRSETFAGVLSLLKQIEKLNPNAVRIAASSSLNDEAIRWYKRRVQSCV